MIRLTFTGDVMCEGTRLNDYLTPVGTYDFSPVFEDLRGIFQESDYVIANLETPIAGEDLKYTFKNYNFNTPVSIATALKECGVDMVTTANNHVLDRGIVGIKNTLKALDDIGLEHTGSFSQPEDNVPLIVKIGELRFAFLSYTYGTEACFNGYYLTQDQQYMVNLLREQELTNPVRRYALTSPAIPAKGFRFIYRMLFPEHAKMDVSQRREKNKVQLAHLKMDIAWCKTHADYTILCLHAGGQFNEEPTEFTKQMVSYALKEGADAVVGNHEHIIHPIKMIHNCPVAYCLGNLTSDYGIRRNPINRQVEYSVLLHLYFGESFVKSTVSLVKSVELNGKIVTRPVYDMWHDSIVSEKKKLEQDIRKCLSIIYGYPLEHVDIRAEYDI